MKKVLVAVALVMGLGSSVAFAQEVINTTSVEMQAQVPQDEFTKIDVKELPEAVAQACLLYTSNYLTCFLLYSLSILSRIFPQA